MLNCQRWVYTDGVLDYENKKDMCVDGKFNIAKNSTYKIVVTQVPEGAIMPTEPIEININDFVIYKGNFRADEPAYATELLIVVEDA